jgi:hypothetical protein
MVSKRLKIHILFGESNNSIKTFTRLVDAENPRLPVVSYKGKQYQVYSNSNWPYYIRL